MTMLEIIEKKKLGGELNAEELRFFANAAADRSVPDYQLAALLMAIRLNGMTPRETADLTIAMRDTGDVVDLSSVPGIKLDKHSTGGVGDSPTLILSPLVAACGVPVANMSGRGLGHTGGTLDKLESIPGMRVQLTEEEYVRQLKDVGFAVVGQTERIAPADKTLYAMRDVTATVDSLPLIVSSIMSKKLAAGPDAIVLDVKTGSGAFMRTLDDSIRLAQALVSVGTMAGKSAIALVTDMNQPLGTHVGNAPELKESIDILAGRTEGALKEVSLALGGYMLMMAKKAESHEEAVKMLTRALESGAGLAKLKEMIAAQGGDPAVCDDVSLLPQAPVRKTVCCERSGYVSAMDTTALGLAAQAMGAGRLKMDDTLDYAVGYELKVRIGDRVTPDTPLCELYARTEEDAERAEQAIRRAIAWSGEPCEAGKLFYALVTADGVTPM